jgi:hypothetical protein
MARKIDSVPGRCEVCERKHVVLFPEISTGGKIELPRTAADEHLVEADVHGRWTCTDSDCRHGNQSLRMDLLEGAEPAT